MPLPRRALQLQQTLLHGLLVLRKAAATAKSAIEVIARRSAVQHLEKRAKICIGMLTLRSMRRLYMPSVRPKLQRTAVLVVS